MTTIEWTEETWNPVTGCTKVSQGCKNCYAELLFPRVYGKERKFTDVRTHEDRLEIPLKRKKPTMYFVNSMSDLFHSDVPDSFIEAVWTSMARARQHTFQILTKRPGRMMNLLCTWERDGRGWREGCKILPNVWLGVSCEDQKTADSRIPLLLDTPAAVRFLSLEPLLGPVDLNGLLFSNGSPYSIIHWVIVGGKSGPNARPMKIEWARELRDQCQAVNVPFFFKQWGEYNANGERVGKKAAGRLLDGREWNEMPEVKR